MSSFFGDVRIALQNLLDHRRRTLLLGGALAAATALLVLMNALATGVDHTLFQSATALTTGHLNVNGFFKTRSGRPAGAVLDSPSVVASVQQAMPELASVVERSRGFGTIVSDEGSITSVISGVTPELEAPLGSALQLTRGRFEDLAAPGTVLLFEAQARKLGVRLGDAVTISTHTLRGVANTLDCRVVAIARDMGILSQWTAFIPQASARELYQLGAEVTGVLHLYVKPEHLSNLSGLTTRLRGVLEQRGYRVLDRDPTPFWQKLEGVGRASWTGPAYDVTTWEDEVSFMTWTLSALRALRAVLGVVLVSIAVAGLMNTFWISIRERTREIGTLRAIGMQRTAVARLFLLEATALAFLGSTAGAAAGWLAALALAASGTKVPSAAQLFLVRETLVLRVEALSVAQTVGLLTFVAGLAALYPASRAARLEPVSAMSHFG